MTTYNSAAVNDSLVRKVPTGLQPSGSPPPTVGQIWPRGNRGAT